MPESPMRDKTPAERIREGFRRAIRKTIRAALEDFDRDHPGVLVPGSISAAVKAIKITMVDE